MLPRANPDYDANKPHHRPDELVNRYIERSDKLGLWRWQPEFVEGSALKAARFAF
jgi:hypothetical protein